MSRRRSAPLNALAWLIVPIWLTLCGYLFWHFELRWTQRYDNQSASFVLEHEPPPSPMGPGQITIAHFIDPNCPCTRFSLAQIALLEKRYEPSATSLRIQRDESPDGEYAWIPASPAVAIWDQQGQLAYVGPHSDGVFCGQGEDLVARVMAQLDTGHNPQWLHWEAVGCFCSWR